ncbi:MAG TPA: NAD(P)H-dependent oxidoreductase [Burkholderiales bacterium]|nr:NAD(P)H-dependent oxidoreductase [Burkholderiales bacterium]
MRIAIIQGHPDAAARHFCHALEAAYADAARQAGHEVRAMDVAKLEVGPVRSKAEWEQAPMPAIREAQETMAWAGHLVVFFPLWLGCMPALLKAFFEHALRPQFAGKTCSLSDRPLAGRSARVIVTMGMPALAFRWYFGAHGLRVLERNILKFRGAGPVRASLVGSVEGSPRRRDRWLARMRDLGGHAR